MRMLLLACLLLALTLPAAAREPTRVAVVSGTQADGTLTSQWHRMLVRRLGDGADAFRAPRVDTAQERAWRTLIESRRAHWETLVPALAADYAPASPPRAVTVVLGNRGAEDAFTHDPTTIGFDLSALQRNYGDAATAENGARIDRFFRHEFVHLMQKAWLAARPAPLGTPLQRAAAELWTEGLGNRESLSSRWAERDGMPADATTQALAELAPRLVARAAALACATDAQARVLTRDLSNGAFTAKWGALPVALWLDHARTRDPGAVRAFIEAGPAGAWTFVESQLSPALRPALREALAAEALCRG